MKRSVLIITASCVVSAVIASAISIFVVNNKLQYGDGAVMTTEVVPTAMPTATARLASYEATAYPDLTYAAESAVKAVVNIEVTSEVEVGGRTFDPFFEFFGFPRGYNDGGTQRREQRSGGSGVIISADGYIVTNNHVVENASKLRVKLNDGRTFDAKTIGRDPSTDVALIKVEADGLPTLPFGSSDELRLGEWVLAIGSPFDLQSTITAGIVSAKARKLDIIPSEFSIESFIQTDAAVNPGNSGGALVNTRGELVGINTVIKSSTGSYIGYSFAVPESIVRKVVVDLREYGVVQRAMLGISYRYIDQDFIDQMGKGTGIKEVGGVYVASVAEGGAASEAGLRKGDIIVAIDGEELTTATALSVAINKHRPSDKIKISVKRGGELKLFEAVLRNKAGKAEPVSREDVDVVESLGGRFTEISSKTARGLDIRSGVQVVEIREGGLLAKARVRRGFIITHLNDRAIASVADLSRIDGKIRSIDGVYPDGRAASYVIVE